MNTSAAYSYLKLSENCTEEQIHEQFEDMVFAIKKELLSKSILLSKWRNKLHLLLQLIEAKNTLLNSEPYTITPHQEIEAFPTDSLIIFMQHYEQELSNAKLQFSNALSDYELTHTIQHVIDVQQHYELHYVSFFNADVSKHDYSGKLSEQISSAEIIRYLKNGGELSEFPNPCLLEFLRLERLKNKTTF
jgi:hypothetical protein